MAASANPINGTVRTEVVVLISLGSSGASRGSIKMCGTDASSLMTCSVRLQISLGRAPVSMIVSTTARPSSFIPSSAPGRNTRVFTHSKTSGVTLLKRDGCSAAFRRSGSKSMTWRQ